MDIPLELREAMGNVLEGVSRAELSERAGRISALYRVGKASAQAIRDQTDALAYMVSRLPATYAAIRHVLGRLQERCPDFIPDSVADLGAGPGTASWAAADIWPGIHVISQFDVNAPLLNLGKKLLESASCEPLRQARIVEADLVRKPSMDTGTALTIAGYLLSELRGRGMQKLLATAWRACTGALVLIEPGTPQGYRRILESRNLVIAMGGKVVAPCPHQLPCPLVAPDWCHFAQRIARTRDHRTVKSAALSFEDEKFSYLIVVRESLSAGAAGGRILASPEVNKAGWTGKLCMPDGSDAIVHVPKRDSEAFQRVKNTVWGDEAMALH
jgi:ribosomal protein RSM22 (predicted rRNA methylase)